jgi:hypothetical protein
MYDFLHIAFIKPILSYHVGRQVIVDDIYNLEYIAFNLIKLEKILFTHLKLGSYISGTSGLTDLYKMCLK